MPETSRRKRAILRVAPLLGIGLLAWLISKVDVHALAVNARAIGWGLLSIIALGGLSHVVKAWAWLLTMQGERRNVSFVRALALRLASEAIGQLGFLGMVGGETARVSLLGSGVSLPAAISSVTLDRGLFIIMGAVVTLAGIAGIGVAVPLPHGLRLYAVALAIVLVCLLIAGAVGIQRRWPVLSASARAMSSIPGLRKWIASKQSTFIASEQRIFGFYQESPGDFWCSVLLNLLCHLLAIAEVFICVRMLGAHATMVGALILESLTKLINVAGSINPGNVGTYEAGNMAIGKLVRLTGAQGLLLALCRRVRAVFWAIIGGICLVWLSKTRRRNGAELSPNIETSTTAMPTQHFMNPSLSLCQTVFILAHDLSHSDQFDPALAKVGTLPLVLRTILGVRGKERVRTVLVINPDNANTIRAGLLATRRVPADMEWIKVPAGTPLPTILRTARLNGGRVSLIHAGSSYRPNLLRTLHDWDGEGGALEFASAGKLIGLVALAPDVAARLAADSETEVVTAQDLHAWIAEKPNVHAPGQSVYEVDEESWQSITHPEDRIAAERKLEGWLVKPTDGIFARMNRRVSIPISRRLIKFPITPNMVSLFTLALSLAAGVFFAAGGYWNCLAGAVLGVLTSILDGCDGEVARLKLQVSDFGCWMDSICDYLYYIVTFAGITIGLMRSKGDPSLAGWSIAVFAGALMTFIVAGIGRKRMAGNRPEQYLQVWQKNAEQRSSGLLVRMARHTEFIVRRCFLPYLLLVLAIFNLTEAFIYMAALGANVAWIVSLRSLIAFSMRSNSATAEAGA